MTFRWFGADDPVPLEHIRQVPGVEGIVSALYHVPPGEVWPKDEGAGLGERIAAAGLRLGVAALAYDHRVSQRCSARSSSIADRRICWESRMREVRTSGSRRGVQGGRRSTCPGACST